MKESEIKEYLMATEDILLPLRRDRVDLLFSPNERADAFLTAYLKDDLPTENFHFLVEAKSQNTPRIVHQAISQIKVYVKERNDPDIFPMIIVPYLSEERLRELEEAKVSGIDLCGNGIVTIPGRLLIFRTGNANRYPESRSVSNPYLGKSGIVGRVFLPVEHSVVLDENGSTALGAVHHAIQKDGIEISMSQVSKTISALVEERILGSEGRAIYVLDPDRLMECLAAAWKRPSGKRVHLRLPDGFSSLTQLNIADKLNWAVTGESSVSRYATFAQGGPVHVAVSDLKKAMAILQGKTERVPNFADVVLVESDEPGFYFDNKKDDLGIRWASLLQTWIELKNGDARQQDAARDAARTIQNLIIAPGYK